MKGSYFSIDLGTTNTVVARWDKENETPEIVRLDGVCRGTQSKKDIDDSYTIPSSVYLLSPGEYLSFPFNIFFKKLKSKCGGLIGMKALQKDGGLLKNRFVDRFKTYLGNNSYRLIGKLDKWSFTAREVTGIFLKSLFWEIKKKTGGKPGHVTFCVPVDFYEVYRAHLKRISFQLKTRNIKTIDEPVAAALGYGIGLDEPKHLIVIDFGAGTLDLALVEIEEKRGKKGKCTVVAKEGVPIGGNTVDAWIVEDICKFYGYDFDGLSKDPDIHWWYRVLLGEACRLKEALFAQETETFYLLPAKIVDKYAPPIPGRPGDFKKPVDYSRTQLAGLLQRKGLYTILDNLIGNLLDSARRKGIPAEEIDEVLMVGGSTLLPDVYALVENRFGRDQVRAWQPFNAVAFGACTFAAGHFQKSDFITHDYALLTYNKETHKPEYQVVIPRGTVFPTAPDFWKRQLVPTCALGEPESIFKLVICEIGKKHTEGQEFIWDEKGGLHIMNDEKDKELIVPLNQSDPTLGHLDPPHSPSEKRARVEISFMVNEDRWLCATVLDIKTGNLLLQERPVIRLK